jgi:hypothetical protein
VALRVQPLFVPGLVAGDRDMGVAAFRLGFFSWAMSKYQKATSGGIIWDSDGRANAWEDSRDVAGLAVRAVALAAKMALGSRNGTELLTVVESSMAAAHAVAGNAAVGQIRQSVLNDLEALDKIERRKLVDEPLWPMDVRDEEYRQANFPLWARNKFDALAFSELGGNGHWRPYVDWYRALLPDTMDGKPTSAFGRRIDIQLLGLPESFWRRDPNEVVADINRVVRGEPIRPHAEPPGPIPAGTAKGGQRESFLLQLDIAASAIPDQVVAPIRVEERDGRISLSHNRDAVLLVEDRDFEHWRVPVVAHIREELRKDFAHGTNHVRVRERLSALLDLVNLPLPEVKDRQFELGYSIQRFRALVAVYQTTEGDMPALPADTLADLELLSGTLELGLSKLELWELFNAQAASVPRGTIIDSVGELGQALDTIVREMESAPSYFDPEVPRTFMFVTEGVRDPVGASKAIIFGAVRSLENLLIGASRRLVRSLRNAADNIETVIASKATIVIAGVLVAGGTSLLGLVPGAGAWLKPVLDLAKQLLGAG